MMSRAHVVSYLSLALDDLEDAYAEFGVAEDIDTDVLHELGVTLDEAMTVIQSAKTLLRGD